MERPRIVRRVHASVEGRTRLAIAGLYRSQAIKRELEQWLGDLSGVSRVDANTRTGRLLVVYTPDLSIEEIIGLIESRLDGKLQVRPKQQASARSSTPLKPLNLNILKALQGVSQVIGRFPPLFDASPVMGSTAGAATAASPVREMQDLLPWHLMDVGKVLEQLGVIPESGLSGNDAESRLSRYGENSLTAAKARSDLAIFLASSTVPLSSCWAPPPLLPS